MVVYLRKSIHSLLSVFKKKGESNIYSLLFSKTRQTAGPKGNEEQKRLTVHYTASQHYQENVFIEGSRPQYLEDLHSEAQEGLKILQQEGQPVIHATTDVSFVSKLTEFACFSWLKKCLIFLSGSTFKPVHPVKRLDRGRKRNRRTTIMGIPNQVQKELGAFPHLFLGPVMSISPQATYLSTIIPNAVLPASVEVIEIDRSNSRTRGSSESAVSPLLSRRSEGDGSQTNSSNNDSVLMPRSASGSNWSESQSSKTVISDSSVASFNRAGFNVQQSQTEEPGNGQDLTSLCSSVNAISSLNKIEINATEVESGRGAAQSLAVGEQAKNKRNCPHSLSVTKTKQPPPPPRRTNSLHGKKIKSESKTMVDFKDLCNSGSGEVKSSSENTTADEGITLVATNAKLSPEPLSNSIGPSSTNSSSAPLNPTVDSSNQTKEAAAQESDASSPHKTPSDGEKFERTMSPSSGYSSQSGTPTRSPKEISPNSPDKQKQKPIKPERSASRASSSAASPSSSLTSLSSGTSEPANADVTNCSTTLPLRDSSPTKEVIPSTKPSSLSAEVQELFNIPPPPKVKAPRPPPPEIWAHSRRTVELLCGPCPDVSKTPLKPAQIQDNEEKQIDPQAEPGKDTQVTAGNQTNQENLVVGMPANIANPGDGKSEAKVREGSNTKQIQNNEKDDTEVKNTEESRETTPKKEPPPVMKKPTKILVREETEQTLSCSPATEVQLSVEDCTTPSQNTVMVPGDKSEAEKSEVRSMQRLTVDVPKMSKLSPPHTPPPAYQPTPPPMRKLAPSLVSSTPNEPEKEDGLSPVDSCWPPPPPPLEEEPVFEGEDELDFPLPPPPSMSDDATNLTGLTPTAAVLPLPDNKSEDTEQVSKADTASETSSQDISCDTDTLSPSSVEVLPEPPVTRAENPMSIQEVVPSSICLKRNSLKLEDQSPAALPIRPQVSASTSVPKAPPPPMESVTPGVNYRRQPSGAHRDPRSKELLSRHKSAPIPKEDANIPLVTPSLLQMVRLRTVNNAHEGAPVLENCPVSSQGPQSIPPKPVRKSLSVKSPPPTVKTPTVTMSSPSMRLQEAIRMKTAAMSSRDCLSPRLGMKYPTYCYTGEQGVQSLKPLEGRDMLKSPASTASFIFSRSTKKVVIEPVASSSEAQASLKQSLAAEIRQVSEQSKAGALSNGRVKGDRIPPPIPKKPAPGSTSPLLRSSSCSAKTELRVEGNIDPGAAQSVTPPKTSKWNNWSLLLVSLVPFRSHVHGPNVCRTRQMTFTLSLFLLEVFLPVKGEFSSPLSLHGCSV
uniref:NHS like 3 n=1 Tax=Fundulus heteroclitus TaxID=8078 RepID=A0A3Q2Q204_FUNHE